MDTGERKRQAVLRLLPFFVGGALLLYLKSFGNDWTLDDFPVIVNNPDIRSLRGFFENSYSVRPLRELTFLLDYALFGLNPAGYHVQQIVWHGTAAFLVFVLALFLGDRKPVALLAATLFLVHPVQVEAVANISHRKDLLAVVFSLLSLLAYMQVFKGRNRRWQWLGAALFLFAVACLAKENAYVLPLAFACYEVSFVPAEERLLMKRKPFLYVFVMLIAVGAVVWFFYLGGRAFYAREMEFLLAKVNLPPPFTVAVYALMMLKGWSFLAARWFFPFNLAPEYVFSKPLSWADPWVLASLAGVVLLGGLLAHSFFRSRRTFFCLALLTAFWLPTANLLPAGYFAADRYLYAPSVGFCLLAAGVLGHAARRRPCLGYGFVLVALSPLVFLTWQQNDVWRSSESLWTQAVAVSPASATALNNLGDVYAKKDDVLSALRYFDRAARANSSLPSPQYNLGWAYDKLGDRDKAVFYFRNFVQRADYSGEPRLQSQAQKVRAYVYKKYGAAL